MSELVSTRGGRARLEGLRTEEEVLDLLVREPKLLRRPIVVGRGRVVVGHDEGALAALVGQAPSG